MMRTMHFDFESSESKAHPALRARKDSISLPTVHSVTLLYELEDAQARYTEAMADTLTAFSFMKKIRYLPLSNLI